MMQTLADVKKALVGLVVMSEELEKLSNSLFDNQVPNAWSEVGFLSLKPLASWVDDLKIRINFLSEWIKNGTPITFFISGMFISSANFLKSLTGSDPEERMKIKGMIFVESL